MMDDAVERERPSMVVEEAVRVVQRRLRRERLRRRSPAARRRQKRISRARRRVRQLYARMRERRRGEISLYNLLGVKELATDKLARAVVSEHASPDDWVRGERTYRINKRKVKARLRDGTAVKATIFIDAYLTKEVPERLRKKTVTVRRPGECLVAAADMYAKLYREDERRGGEPAFPTRKDIARRVRKRLRAGGGPLLNRGFGPYIWGHDIGDLVFEAMYVKQTGPRSCVVRFSIGS